MNTRTTFSKTKKNIYKLALKMIAVARLYLKDVNIASTTALQAMYPWGREEGLLFGANVIMPNITPIDARKNKGQKTKGKTGQNAENPRQKNRQTV